MAIDEFFLPNGQSLRVHYATDGTVREIAGPGAMRTAFAWTRPSDGAGLQMISTLADGTSQTLRLGPALLKFQDWGLRDPAILGPDAKTVGLQIRRTDAAGGGMAALAAQDKILLKSDAQREAVILDSSGHAERIVDGSLAPATDAEAAITALESEPEWRTRLTPGSFRSGHSGIRRDAAGRPTEIPAGGSGKEVWQWDEADRLVAWTDVHGRKTSYEYDANDHLVAVSQDGRVLARAEFDAAGLLSRLRDASGDETTFVHDAAGNLTQISGSTRESVEFAYDASSRLVSVARIGGSAKLSYGARGLLERVADSAGHTTSFAYDDGRLATQLDENGDRISYAYDAQGRLSGVAYPHSSIEYSYAAGSVVAQFKSADGHEMTAKQTSAGRATSLKLAGGPEISAQYDLRGLPVSISDSTGGATTYAYDAEGRLSSRAAASGDNKLSYRYDDSGRLVEIRGNASSQTFQYDAGGETDLLIENGRTSKERYDRDGRLLARWDADGSETRYEYTQAGALAAIASPSGARLEYQRDAAGRTASIAHTYQGRRAVVSYAYDDAGRVTRHTREDGTSESYGYDASGRLVERTSPLDNHYRYQYDDHGRIAAIEGPFGTERFEYDAAGRITEHADPVQGTFRFEYSDRPDAITTIDPNGARTRVSLNAQGQPVQIEDPQGDKIVREYDKAGRLSAFVDPNGNRTTWTYDDKTRSVERRTPLGKIYWYRYDERSNLTEMALPGGRVIHREYDAAGRLARLVPADGEPWLYHYDGRGRLQSVEGPAGRVSYDYDELDRVTEYRDVFGNAIAIAYDAVGRRESLRMPDGQLLNYVYNAQGLLEAVEAKSGTIKYGYDKTGRLSTIAYPNGVTVNYEYSAGARLKSVIATNARGVTLLREAYEYDARGNVVTIAEGGDLPAPQEIRDEFRRSMGVTRYSYDVLNRIVAARYPTGTEERFSYDANGNLIHAATTRSDAGGAKIHADIPYAYDADQALVAQGPFTATPDPDGNFCGDWNRSGCDFKYDAFDRLVGWHDQTYRYDGEGHLMDWRDAKGDGARFTYLGQSLLAEADAQGNLAKLYIPGPDGRFWSAMRAGDDDFYPVRSANGSLLAVTDKRGEVAASCLYRSYGVAFSWSKSASSAPCEFAGGRMQGPGFWFGTRVLHGIGARF
jgi:YD repeat-containing protein